MSKITRVCLVGLTALAVMAAAGLLYRAPALGKARQEKAALAAREDAEDDKSVATALRQRGEEFVKAFNKGDAKALAGFWTKEGEFVGPDDETLRGRAAIEEDYVQFFKDHPKARLEVKISNLRVLGARTAVTEGTLKVWLNGEGSKPTESRYSVFHVREDDGWRMAHAREWVPSPEASISLKDVDWLVGEWTAKGQVTEAHSTYEWDEAKVFLRSRYTLKREGNATTTGTMIIGKDPEGGLRSWQFDDTGSFAESSWSRDGERWVIETTATLPEGTELTAVNILVPIDKDAFTWQSTQRTADGAPLPDVPPVKVTRVQAQK
jgi:uncharacterized protein (TIGR02246 family)